MIGFKNYTFEGFSMLLNTITERHPNSFVLLKPKSRDKQNNVRDWNVLNTAKKYDDILRVAEYYRSEGISNAVILSTSDELVVPPEESAKFFRVFDNPTEDSRHIADFKRCHCCYKEYQAML